MVNVIKYDPFTGMSFSKKKVLVDFLCSANNIPLKDRERMQKTVDYAMKDTTSFGGFIITLEKNYEIKGAIVANKSGMGGFIPTYMVAAYGVHATVEHEEAMSTLLQEANKYAKGDIAIVKMTKPSNVLELLLLDENNIKYLKDNASRDRMLKVTA